MSYLLCLAPRVPAGLTDLPDVTSLSDAPFLIAELKEQLSQAREHSKKLQQSHDAAKQDLADEVAAAEEAAEQQLSEVRAECEAAQRDLAVARAEVAELRGARAACAAMQELLDDERAAAAVERETLEGELRAERAAAAAARSLVDDSEQLEAARERRVKTLERAHAEVQEQLRMALDGARKDRVAAVDSATRKLQRRCSDLASQREALEQEVAKTCVSNKERISIIAAKLGEVQGQLMEAELSWSPHSYIRSMKESIATLKSCADDVDGDWGLVLQEAGLVSKLESPSTDEESSMEESLVDCTPSEASSEPFGREERMEPSTQVKERAEPETGK